MCQQTSEDMKLYISISIYSFLPSFRVHLGKMRDACSVVLCKLREDKEEEGKTFC